MSVMFPKWLRSKNFLPRWLGGTENTQSATVQPQLIEYNLELIQPAVTAISGGGRSSTYAPPERLKVEVRLGDIMITQNDHEATLKPDLIRKDFRKDKYRPIIELKEIDFKERLQ